MNPAIDLKTHFDPQKSGDNQTLSGTTAVNGTGVDCANYNGPIYALCVAGSAANSPTTQAHVCKLQECATSGGVYTDIATQDQATISADKGAVILRGHRTMRYVRTVVTPAFTGGSSPTNTVDTLVLGQKQNTSD